MAGTFPSRGVWRRPSLRPVDVIVFAALLALLYGLLRLAPALNAPFLPRTAPSRVSTDPANLPYYAVRSLLRMFIGLILSVLFTFVYATAAAAVVLQLPGRGTRLRSGCDFYVPRDVGWGGAAAPFAGVAE